MAESTERVGIARIVVDNEGKLFFEALLNEFGVFGEAYLGIKTTNNFESVLSATDHGPEANRLLDKVGNLNQDIKIGGNGLIVTLVGVRTAPTSK